MHFVLISLFNITISNLNHKLEREAIGVLGFWGHIAIALPQPARTIDQANHVESQTMLALGLIEQPHRTAIQTRHDSTPDTAIFMALASAKDKLFKQFESSETWTASTKESVRIQVEKFEAVIAQIKTRLV